MTPEDRDAMIDLCRRIHRETDLKKLVALITDLNELIVEEKTQLFFSAGEKIKDREQDEKGDHNDADNPDYRPHRFGSVAKKC